MRIRPILPSRGSAAKLFLTGATVGPVVDSLHNQCLLAYDFAPITLANPVGTMPIFCSSWIVPPLLGIAYVVLGGVLPRVASAGLPEEIKSMRLQIPFLHNSEVCQATHAKAGVKLTNKPLRAAAGERRSKGMSLRNTAIVAVMTTALIIKLSEFLQTNNIDAGEENVAIMALASFTQWAVLDRTPAALLAAVITSVGGPLSELPFVASGCWHYLPQAADYLPLANLADSVKGIACHLFGDDYSELALSSITGPCYFAVTMDAVALGRYFDEAD